MRGIHWYLICSYLVKTKGSKSPKTSFSKFSKNSKKSQKNRRDLNLVSKDAHWREESIGMQHVPHYPKRIPVWGEKPLFTPKKGGNLTQKLTFLTISSIESVDFLHTARTSWDAHYSRFLAKSEYFCGFQAKNKKL